MLNKSSISSYYRTAVLCALLMFSFQSFAQFDISWGEVQRKRGQLLYILPRNQGEFFALRWSGGQILGHYSVSRHVDNELNNIGRISMIADNSIAKFKGAHIFDDQFAVFLTDRKENKNIFYLQYYSDSLEVEGESIKLAEYGLEGRGGKGDFTFKLSPDGKYLGVIWLIPGKKENSHVYGFKIYNSDLELMNEGEYKIPFSADLTYIHEHYVSNNAGYFLCMTEYDRKPNLFNRENTIDKKLHIFNLAEDIGLQNYQLQLEGKWIESMALHAYSDSLFTLTGIYGKNNEEGVSGLFYKTVNLLNEDVLREGQKEFDKEFITKDWSQRAIDRTERRRRSNRTEPQLYNYVMRDVLFREDGSMVCTLEQYFVQMRSSPDMRTAQGPSVYYYYYNDIVAYKIDTTGEFDWIVKIPKYQVSMNDGGPYSGYKSFIHQDDLFFVFNDHIRNYDENGVFIDSSRIHMASTTKRRNAVAEVRLNLENGEVDRRTFLSQEENTTLVVPKLFNENRRHREMILYSIARSRERIGILKLE